MSGETEEFVKAVGGERDGLARAQGKMAPRVRGMERMEGGGREGVRDGEVNVGGGRQRGRRR